jgi:1,4-alpha-glucan branching enzyme
MKRKESTGKRAPKSRQPARTEPARTGAARTEGAKTEGAEKKRVEFSYHAPEAHEVSLAGTFNDWSSRTMRKDEEGTWRAGIVLPPGTYQYRFVVDGEWRDDPGCPERAPNDMGGENCVVNVQS